MTESEPKDLQALRESIRALEGAARGKAPAAVLPLGMEAIDSHLPDGGLRLAGLHELWPARPEWDDGPTTGFLLALAAPLLTRSRGALLWVSRADDLYAPAAALAGLPPKRLLRVHVQRREDLLWALEQGLRCSDLAGVVGEVAGIDPVAARRLQLAAEKERRPCFLLHRFSLRDRDPVAAGPAVSRWRIEALPSEERLPRQLVGKARWRLELLRCRGGLPAHFEVEWDYATDSLTLAAPLFDRKAADSA